MSRPSRVLFFSALAALAVGWGTVGRAGTASNLTGLYYTGDTSGGSSLATQGGHDGNWTVSYASTNGGTSDSTTNEGTAYVVSSTYVDAAWVQNTSTAQWITAPGATNTSGANVNQGGDSLPGNGTAAPNEGIYVYTLAFQITGTGSGTVTNHVAISLTIAADDAYYVYVNPTGNTATTLPSGTVSGSRTNAWNNTSSLSLANYTDSTNGYTNNASFVIGTNYLVIEVVNSNSMTGSSTNTAINPSGLLVYQVGSLAVINGNPIPEMSTWVPLALAGLMGAGFLARRRPLPASAFGAA